MTTAPEANRVAVAWRCPKTDQAMTTHRVGTRTKCRTHCGNEFAAVTETRPQPLR
jgi:hypothetical protein